MPKFIKKVKGLGFESCAREQNSWRVRVSWNPPPKGSSPADIDIESFADECTQRMSEKQLEVREREQFAAKWVAHRDKLLDEAAELFKQRCIRAAMNMQCQAVVSFEVLTRELKNFPTYSVKDGTYLVDAWGDAAAAWWFYDTRGTQEAWQAGTPVQFAEVLEGMMPKFVEKVGKLGFKSCAREPSSWRVRVAWREPDEAEARSSSEEVQERAPRRKRKTRSSPPKEESPVATAPADEDDERVATEEAGSPAEPAVPEAPPPPPPPAEEDEKVDTEEANSLEAVEAPAPNEEARGKKAKRSRTPSHTEVPSATDCASSDGEDKKRRKRRSRS